MISSNQIGGRISEVRRQRSLSQQDVADGVHCSRQYISEVENGKTSCTLDVFQEIAKFIGTSLTKLLDLRTPEEWDDPRHQAIHTNLQRILESDGDVSGIAGSLIAALHTHVRRKRRSVKAASDGNGSR